MKNNKKKHVVELGWDPDELKILGKDKDERDEDRPHVKFHGRDTKSSWDGRYASEKTGTGLVHHIVNTLVDSINPFSTYIDPHALPQLTDLQEHADQLAKWHQQSQGQPLVQGYPTGPSAADVARARGRATDFAGQHTKVHVDPVTVGRDVLDAAGVGYMFNRGKNMLNTVKDKFNSRGN